MNTEIVYKGARRHFGIRYSGPEWIFLLLAAMAAVAGIGVVGAFLLKVLF
jgi:hypothetical protein